MPDTPKRHHNNIKTSRKETQKHHFAMFKNNPLFFITFLFCSTYIFCFWKAVFSENTIKIVFSAKHSFSKTQLVKPTFSAWAQLSFPVYCFFLALINLEFPRIKAGPASIERGAGLRRRQMQMFILEANSGSPNFLPPAILGRSLRKGRALGPG